MLNAIVLYVTSCYDVVNEAFVQAFKVLSYPPETEKMLLTPSREVAVELVRYCAQLAHHPIVAAHALAHSRLEFTRCTQLRPLSAPLTACFWCHPAA
jgi:hypothetical protein